MFEHIQYVCAGTLQHFTQLRVPYKRLQASDMTDQVMIDDYTVLVPTSTIAQVLCWMMQAESGCKLFGEVGQALNATIKVAFFRMPGTKRTEVGILVIGDADVIWDAQQMCEDMVRDSCTMPNVLSEDELETAKVALKKQLDDMDAKITEHKIRSAAANN